MSELAAARVRGAGKASAHLPWPVRLFLALWATLGLASLGGPIYWLCNSPSRAATALRTELQNLLYPPAASDDLTPEDRARAKVEEAVRRARKIVESSDEL